MAILELIEQGATEEEAIQIAVEQLGMYPAYAWFVLATERGEIDGDIIEIEEEA